MEADDQIAELASKGFCVLKKQLARSAVENCRKAFWPILLEYIRQNEDKPNRGPHRHFLPMPFDPPCFAPDFFFDLRVLAIVHGSMCDRIAADQWGCDVPVKGSQYQEFHVDYRRPLFAECPDLPLPAYMLIVSFSLVDITAENGPMEIIPGSHTRPQPEGCLQAQPVTMEVGDMLIRHPWALHRGTPNLSNTPRALVSIRYVRRWYADSSREVNPIPGAVWQSLTPGQQEIMRFPTAVV